jgi:hypothetical protein
MKYEIIYYKVQYQCMVHISSPQHLLLMTFSIAGSLVMMSTNLEQYKSCLLIHVK